MSILNDIYEGWKSYIFKSPEHKEMAETRMKICVSCPFFTPKRRCQKCGCFMPAKVRTEKAKCPIGRWN